MVCFFIFLGRGELREEEEREDSVRREKKSRCGGLFLFFIVDFRKGYSWNYFVKIVFFKRHCLVWPNTKSFFFENGFLLSVSRLNINKIYLFHHIKLIIKLLI